MISTENEIWNYLFPLAEIPTHRYDSVGCILRYRIPLIADCIILVIWIAYFSQLNVNVKTDSGTDDCSASALQHSKWEVSAYSLTSCCSPLQLYIKVRGFYLCVPPSLFVKPYFSYCLLLQPHELCENTHSAHIVDLWLFQGQCWCNAENWFWI